MTEPDVALTDFALTLECGAFALWLDTHGARGALRYWLVLFFSGAALAALAGGAVHGFLVEPGNGPARVLWPLAMLAVGVSALAGWALAAKLALPDGAARIVTLAAWAELLLYGALVVAGHSTFELAIVDYAPASVALLAACGWRARRGDLPGSGFAALGIALTCCAPLVQQSTVDLHPRFTHNALFHVVQGVGFALFFAGARRWVAATPQPEGTRC